MKQYLSAIRDVFSNDILRVKLLRTVVFIFLFRLGTHCLLPGIDPAVLTLRLEGIMALMDKLVMLGSAYHSRSIFALGIGPYIQASIIMQMLAFSLPVLQRLQKEGAAGKARINQLTRYVALLLSFVQGIFYGVSMSTQVLDHEKLLCSYPVFVTLTPFLLVGGTMCCIWLSDRIAEEGIGKGSSVLLVSSIVSGFPRALWIEWQDKIKGLDLLALMVELVLFWVLVTVVIGLMQGVHKIPLHYAQHGHMSPENSRILNNHLPIKFNSAGVMPIIVAYNLLSIPMIIANLLKNKSEWAKNIFAFSNDFYSWAWNGVLSTLIILSTFAYVAIFTNTTEIADELKKSNGFIPGIKPGKSTAYYIDNILSLITLPNALFLSSVTVLPAIAHKCNVTDELSHFLGGSSLLILISVILDLIAQVQGYLDMQYYTSTLKNRVFTNFT